VATGAIRPGEVLLTIPRKLVITHDRCHDEDQTRAGGVLGALSAPIFTSLLIFLLAELEDGASFYRDWMVTLPAPGELHNAPYMSEEELKKLETEAREAGEDSEAAGVWGKVTAVRDKLRASQQFIAQQLTQPFPEAFPMRRAETSLSAPAEKDTHPGEHPEGCSSPGEPPLCPMESPQGIEEGPFGLEKQRWAGAVVLSRAFSVNGHTVVLPLIDALNHDPNLGGDLRWNADGEFEVVSGASYEAGQEVYLCYGPPEKMGNDNLLATYGFAL
jgi:hypothetical protein